MAETTYISLFAGAGGLDLGLRIAMPQARCVCYVEGDLSAARILAARIEDLPPTDAVSGFETACLADAPLWSDVRTFDGTSWRRLVDGIIGGFPCQDLSVAGKRRGIGGQRSGLWGEMRRIIGEVEPRWCFIENVDGIVSSQTILHRREIVEHLDALDAAIEAQPTARGRYYAEYHRERLHRRLLREHGISALLYVLCQLDELGYASEVGLFSAAETGASHERARCFILAHRRYGRQQTRGSDAALCQRSEGGNGSLDQRSQLAYRAGDRWREQWSGAQPALQARSEARPEHAGQLSRRPEGLRGAVVYAEDYYGRRELAAGAPSGDWRARPAGTSAAMADACSANMERKLRGGGL